jgi:hypothetical protein
MISYEATLEKLSTNENALRTKTVKGITLAMPCPGESFVIFGESLSTGSDCRMVTTSAVKSVEFKAEAGVIKTAQFRTQSGSEYLLTIDRADEIEVLGSKKILEAARA